MLNELLGGIIVITSIVITLCLYDSLCYFTMNAEFAKTRKELFTDGFWYIYGIFILPRKIVEGFKWFKNLPKN